MVDKIEYEIQDKTLYAHFLNIILGAWLVTFPFTVDNASAALSFSQIISGVIVITLSLLSFNPRRWWAPWMTTLVGIWLQLSPLIFWASNPATYLNDSIVGILVIIFSVMVPIPPKNVLDTGPEIPPGWSYNPSSWIQRIPIIGIGLIGWLAARYMAAFQLGYISSVWDPVFGNGTEMVLTSKVSKAFPISDAGLGAVAYILEALMGAQGGSKRWHQMPWSVVVFGMIVVPLGLTSIILIILQPLSVGYWCFWCLLVAFCMLIMISLTVDEVALVIEVLKTSKERNKGFWREFWTGAEIEDGDLETLPPISSSLFKTLPSMIAGINFPITLNMMVVTGGVLMAGPSIFTFPEAAASGLYIVGPLVVVTATVAYAEITRYVRYIAIPFALWLLLSLVIFSGHSVGAIIFSITMATFLIILSVPKGKIEEKYGRYRP